MPKEKLDISIIIINYRVKDYILLLLDSIEKARNKFSIEIFIVDNDSRDGSIEYLSKRYPKINFIQNEENYGFGKANNQALSRASGRYTLIINPDTILKEDSLIELITVMDHNTTIGAAGFKMLNPDGTFARECKRSVPNLRSAVFRVLGLDTIFFTNKYFGERYLGWLPENEIAEVPVISGAGMFWRTSLIKELNGFDESFFMYGEDDDICFRVQDTDYNIQYFPKAVLVHFKGESEVSVSIKSLKKVNSGLLQFFRKHFHDKYSKLSHSLISIAFYFRILFIYIHNLLFDKESSSSKINNPFLVLGDLKTKSCFDEANIINNDFKCMHIDVSQTQDVFKKIKENLVETKGCSIIFDVKVVPYSSAFEIMEHFKDQKISFRFLLRGDKKIIGKSHVINI